MGEGQVENSVLISAAITLFALTGCATCQKHPIACTVGAGLVAGSIVASSGHSNPDRHIDTPSVNCDSGACR